MLSESDLDLAEALSFWGFFQGGGGGRGIFLEYGNTHISVSIDQERIL